MEKRNDYSLEKEVVTRHLDEFCRVYSWQGAVRVSWAPAAVRKGNRAQRQPRLRIQVRKPKNEDARKPSPTAGRDLPTSSTPNQVTVEKFLVPTWHPDS